MVLDAHGRHAQAVAFTKDGKRLVSTGQDACIRLWSIPGFQAEGMFKGHANSVNSMSFSPDGTLLATGSTDGTVRVWSFPQGRCLHILEKQTTPRLAPYSYPRDRSQRSSLMETAVFHFGSTNLTVWLDTGQATELAAAYEKGVARYALQCHLSMSSPEETVWLDLSRVLWLVITRPG
jgi:WD40 repeat protein